MKRGFTFKNVLCKIISVTNLITLEECQSGWLERSWKPSYVRAYRGFESHLLLHLSPERGFFVVWDENRKAKPCLLHLHLQFEKSFKQFVFFYPVWSEVFLSSFWGQSPKNRHILRLFAMLRVTEMVESLQFQTTPKVTFVTHNIQSKISPLPNPPPSGGDLSQIRKSSIWEF